jgi:hypothetical protein
MPKYRHHGDPSIYQGQKCDPTEHGVEDNVIDVEKIYQEAREEEEEREM